MLQSLGGATLGGMWKEILTALPPDVIGTLVSLVFTCLNVLIGLALNELRKHFKSAAANATIDRVERGARTAVASVEQRYVQPLKALNGGKLTPADVAQVQKLAVTILKDELGKAGFAAINAITHDTESVLRDKIEAAVRDMRQASEAAPVNVVNQKGAGS